jgi:hypothetical protein
LTEQFVARVRATNAEIEDMQRLVAHPKPYRFVIQKAEMDGETASGKK